MTGEGERDAGWWLGVGLGLMVKGKKTEIEVIEIWG